MRGLLLGLDDALADERHAVRVAFSTFLASHLLSHDRRFGMAAFRAEAHDPERMLLSALEEFRL